MFNRVQIRELGLQSGPRTGFDTGRRCYEGVSAEAAQGELPADRRRPRPWELKYLVKRYGYWSTELDSAFCLPLYA